MTAEQLAAYDVEWTTPSQDATGSMPIGNGDLAANVWVEPNGDVLLLVAKGDAWDENSTLCKLGRVRLTFEPRPSVEPFLQSLRLSDATLSILIGHVGVRIWVDANASVIRIEVQSAEPVIVIARLETWRDYPYRLFPTQTGDMFKNLTGRDPFPTIISPDEVAAGGSVVAACHANVPREHDPVAINLTLQGLGDMVGRITPLSGRVFGMAVVGRDFGPGGARAVKSPRNTTHRVEVHGLTLAHSSADAWRTAMIRQIDRDVCTAAEFDEAAVDHWMKWRDFWDGSTLILESTTDAENAFNISRAYLLQRYMNACQGRAAQPIKFNGGLFSVGRPWDPDFRRWGGPGFWFQNLRLVYWPMLADGDFDLMKPWIKMYHDCLPLQQHRTKTYYGHDGAHYPETMTFWGAEVSGHYGWTPFEQRERPEAECAYLTYYWSGGVELTLMICEYVEHTLDVDAMDALDEVGRAVLTFYEEHYPRSADGTIRFEPAQALETWHKAVDPMPEIAGLRYLTARLLAMPDHRVSAELLDQCRRLAASLPPLPVGEKDGEPVLLPAAEFDIKKNTENPELYCIFPYRLFGVGKPDLDLARRTFAKRLHVEYTCWHQDAIQMALLGLTEEAKDFVSRRASPACASDSRFPAFWNAFHDWNPDVDHGGVLQLAVQNMLVQCDGRTIRLLPAWPKEWDAEFKFHLPGPAVIEGQVKGGRLTRWAIDPPERAKDVILPAS